VGRQNEIRILIVDDHPVVRFGLAAIIKGQPGMSVAAEAATGKEAVELFFRHKPDITLMDLRLPGMSGLDAIRRILSAGPSAKIIVLTTYEGDEDIHQALDAGAKGYLLKDAPHSNLVKAIQQVYAGGRFIPPGVAEALAARTPSSDLTPRERQILSLIVKGLSNKGIAEALGISEGTVKTHVIAILGRLGVEGRTQAAVVALQRGIIHL
jgi:DNA-binding NarL/FixJ family response regulator